jgi:Skp family chaperone for outer membrane proteins
MKTLLKLILPCVVLLTAMAGTASAQTKIATVDLSRVFTNYFRTQQADVALRDRQADMARSEKEMLDQWQVLKDDYQKLLTDAGSQAVSTEERERRSKAAEDKLKELKTSEENIVQFRRQATTNYNEHALRVRDNLLAEIRTAVNARAKSGGYQLVLDIAAMSIDRTPIVVYTTGENDLTEAVLSQLNAAAPADAAPPRPDVPANAGEQKAAPDRKNGKK